MLSEFLSKHSGPFVGNSARRGVEKALAEILHPERCSPHRRAPEAQEGTLLTAYPGNELRGTGKGAGASESAIFGNKGLMADT